ncbi:hypothetical protein AGDE_15907 [Angomonas deanei]|uniref:Uncharacterized protein n=1 Tax=Angomonas deanei TaxID=59799 RepID=A0A7G2CKC2_9TRYP|nr:hypothetical protein AGDE_15907 [Angomonas deanei]CAD2219354.1 hypothetical protein, conserved [Angomonas deanei]|eukprot:EPY18176.1 hypothetical protein AGDE_15907 [Angomonas deanei]
MEQEIVYRWGKVAEQKEPVLFPFITPVSDGCPGLAWSAIKSSPYSSIMPYLERRLRMRSTDADPAHPSSR